MSLFTREMACQELVELVTAYFDGSLSRRDRRRFRAHISGCDHCTAYVEQMRLMILEAERELVKARDSVTVIPDMVETTVTMPTATPEDPHLAAVRRLRDAGPPLETAEELTSRVIEALGVPPPVAITLVQDAGERTF